MRPVSVRVPRRARLGALLALGASISLGAALPGVAQAQVAPTMPTPGQPGGEAGDKPEGVAEAAPKTPGLLPTTPALPPPKSKRKKFELFELDGYYRLRGDWFKNFNLGFRDDVSVGGAPFPCAIGDGSDLRCKKSHRSTNMRLRLEPTIAIDETTEVHMQVDVLDNVVLGSTTEGFLTDRNPDADPTFPDDTLGPFRGNQAPPQAGVNSDRDSIAVKRAWVEIATPLGLIEAGRMPAHWGTGMLINGGAADPINGGYDLDSEGGDTVDRVMFSTNIPGTAFRAGIGTDWLGTQLAANQTDLWATRIGTGQPWDMDDDDDVSQWLFVISRMDSPQAFRDTVDRDRMALNYGAYVTYRTQDYDLNYDEINNPTPPMNGLLVNPMVRRDATIYSPDLWLKFGWKKLLVEAEIAAVLGKIDALGDQAVSNLTRADVRQLGGVARASYRAAEDKLRVGFEVGFASGDQWDNTVEGQTHISSASILNPGDDTLSRFVFNPEYKIDLILFRELIGAVTNTTYVRPHLAYDLTKSITFKIQNVTSFAHRAVSTPGNGQMLGIEFDSDIGYSAGGLFAGLSYGVLFPLSGMDHPDDPAGTTTGGGFPYNNNDTSTTNDNFGDSSTAHTIQARLAVQF